MSDLNSIMPYVIIVLMVIVGITNLITYFSKSSKKSANYSKRQFNQSDYQSVLQYLYEQDQITHEQMMQAENLSMQEQQRFLAEQIQNLNQQQLQNLQAMETFQNMSTGFEFGGWNPDPNLNPGMQHDMDQMNHFNDFNNNNLNNSMF